MSPTYQAGDCIGGRYTVLSSVTRGLFNERYHCQDLLTDSFVTLETLQAPYRNDAKLQKAFNDTAILWLNLGTHHNFVRLYRVEDIDNVRFMILDPFASADGNTLRTHLAQGVISARQAFEYVLDICKGYKHAQRLYDKDFVHGSLNPDTVLITEKNIAQIDGLYVNEPQGQSTVDSDSGFYSPSLKEQPAYMSPEQWIGGVADQRTDIYAIGLLLFEMITGEPLFQGNVETLRKHHLSTQPELDRPDFPPELQAIFKRCFEKNKTQRFATIDLFRQALSTYYEKQFKKKSKRTSGPIQLSSDNYLERAQSYNRLNHPTRAMIELNALPEDFAAQPQVRLERTLTLLAQKRYSDALNEAIAILETAPDQSLALYYAGCAAAERGDLLNASAYLEQAVQHGVAEAVPEHEQIQKKLQAWKHHTLQLSVAARLVRKQAATEARKTHYEFIEPEHLLNGITKLEDLAKRVHELNLQPNVVPTFLAEVEGIAGLFRGINLPPRQMRRAMRVLLNDGGFTHPESTDAHISRSPVARFVFDRAERIALSQNSPVVGVQHLLAAILDSNNPRIAELFKSLRIPLETFHRNASSLQTTSAATTTTPFLSKWGIDLTQLAIEGKLYDATGRDEEIAQVLRALSRESKNNPVLVGEPGVGKTAIVEGLAHRIAANRISPIFQGKRIIQINVSDFVAGTKYRGEFEERMHGIVKEASENPNIILFIDELHMIVGAGLVEDSNMDAANILKPALARGAIKLIGATTEAEYYRYLGKDAAFERRLQPIKVEEPNTESTRHILSAIRERLKKHHGVVIRDDAIDAAISLSVRYMPARRLPDKARDLLDEACAYLQSTSPTISIEDSVEVGYSPEKVVTIDTIREVVAEKVGVPVTRMTDDEAQRILKMPDVLRQRVIGQDRAIEAVSSAIRQNYAQLRSGKRPIGVFLFVGPSGVGKTELAKATANFLFGSDKRMIRLDMSEYMEHHSVSRLIGAPPGYVGYEAGGQLTELLRRTPYIVVLLDEVEKAHPDVLNVFLQAFGEGRLTDGQGRTVDASNVIFMMTSNLGAYNATPVNAPLGFNRSSTNTTNGVPPKANMTDTIGQAVMQYFRPELLNRLDEIIVFEPLSADHMIDIVQVHLKPLHESLEERGIKLTVTKEAIEWLAQHGFSEHYGARPLIRLIDKEITNEIGGLILAGHLAANSEVCVIVDSEGLRITG
jgi:ATP-dependent Clp protease ATP-binding subunit ClpC